MATRRKPKAKDARSVRKMRKWWAAGAAVTLIGGAWAVAGAANANPLFSSHHHHQGQNAAANGNANTSTGANTGAGTSAGASASASAGGNANGNGNGGAQATGAIQMQSHTDVMQEWSPSGSSAGGNGNANGNGSANGNGNGTGNVIVNAAGVAATTSTNWAGYADTGAKFTSVSAAWTQPAANCAANQTFSSYWVGLDGDGTASVEQTGSEADCQNGAPVYFGWFEMFPAAPVAYNNPVAAGDAMSASVTTDGNGNFTLTLTDATQGWNQVTNQTLATAQLGSAEVVAEAPSSQNGVLPLTNFGTVNFTNALANGTPIGTTGTPSSLTMVNGVGATKASASALANNTNFSVTWAASQ